MNSKLNTPPIANICIKVLYFDNRLTSIFLFLFQRDKLNLKNETIISLIAIIKNGIATIEILARNTIKKHIVKIKALSAIGSKNFQKFDL